MSGDKRSDEHQDRDLFDKHFAEVDKHFDEMSTVLRKMNKTMHAAARDLKKESHTMNKNATLFTIRKKEDNRVLAATLVALFVAALGGIMMIVGAYALKEAGDREALIQHDAPHIHPSDLDTEH